MDICSRALMVMVMALVMTSLLSFTSLSWGEERDKESGLIIDKGWEEVSNSCSACHSLRLVQQNRLSRERWLDAIRWMQDEHDLWDLEEDEDIILDYLAKHYGS